MMHAVAIVILAVVSAFAAALMIAVRGKGFAWKAALIGSFASFIIISSVAIVVPGGPRFAGTWNSYGGKLILVQKGDRVLGTYEAAVPGKIEGTVSGTRLRFRWTDRHNNTGRGYWDLVQEGGKLMLKGRWGSGDSDSGSGEWTASRDAVSGEGEAGYREKRGGGSDSGGKKILSKPVMPFGTHKCVSCPSPNRNGVLPQDRWLVIITSSEGPNQAMFLNSRTGVLHDAEYPDQYVKTADYPCFQRCYTFESQNVLKVFDPNTGQAHRYPIKILNFGMNTYVFGPKDGQDRSWDALQYPGWGPNGETDLSSRCDCR